MTRKQRATDKQIVTWDFVFIAWAKALQNLSGKIRLLQENPGYCYSALNLWLNFCFYKNRDARLQVNSNEIYEILRRAMENDSDFTLLIPFLFSVIDSQQKSLIQAQQHFVKFNQFAAQAQKRITELESELLRLKE